MCFTAVTWSYGLFLFSTSGACQQSGDVWGEFFSPAVESGFLESQKKTPQTVRAETAATPLTIRTPGYASPLDFILNGSTLLASSNQTSLQWLNRHPQDCSASEELGCLVRPQNHFQWWNPLQYFPVYTLCYDLTTVQREMVYFLLHIIWQLY